MKALLKTTVAAVALAGAALFASSPAQAGVSLSFSIGIPNAIAFDYDSGGYCDDWGCPDEYWDLPVYYGPVYYRNRWFQGPVYYRNYHGEHWFWLRGGWRRDEWRGPRPRWWKSNYRFGPALGYQFYMRNGFRHDRDRFWRGNDWRPGHDWDRNRWRNWDRDHRDDRHDNDRGDNHWPFGGRDNDRDRNNGGSHVGGSVTGPGGGGMTGPGGNGPGNGTHTGGGMTGPGGGGMNGPGGGGMTGPGGNGPGSGAHPGGGMTGPGGGGMTGPAGGMTGPGNTKPSGGGMTGPGGGSMTGPAGTPLPAIDKPKHKKPKSDDQPGGN